MSFNSIEKLGLSHDKLGEQTRDTGLTSMNSKLNLEAQKLRSVPESHFFLLKQTKEESARHVKEHAKITSSPLVWKGEVYNVGLANETIMKSESCFSERFSDSKIMLHGDLASSYGRLLISMLPGFHVILT